MPQRRRNKLMTAAEAVAEFVHDGDIIFFGYGGSYCPYALGYEVIRQHKTGLDIVGGTPGPQLQQLMFHTGVADRTRSAAIVGMLGAQGPGRVWQLVEEGKVRFEDYTNQTTTLMFMAAALGIPFIPTRSLLGTDFIKDEYVEQAHGFLGKDKLRVIEDPFSGRPVVALPALKPGVMLWHVQRADEEGNCQAWGAYGDAKWALWAAERVVISAEEIVPTSAIRSDPNRTILPGMKVSAVVREPFGGFPGELPGYYTSDAGMNRMSHDAFDDYLAEWVYGCPDHKAFMQHYVEKFGFQWLQGFLPKGKAHPHLAVDYGIRPIVGS